MEPAPRVHFPFGGLCKWETMNRLLGIHKHKTTNGVEWICTRLPSHYKFSRYGRQES